MEPTRSTRRSEVSEARQFERMYSEHFDAVARYVLARTDRDSASDALSRTFEIAWRRITDVPDQPLPWLLGVARRVLSEQRRAAGRRDALIERIAASVATVTDDDAASIVQRELTVQAIADLPQTQQEALLLIAWDDLTQREAAEVIGCSRAALALRLHRARARLREVLKDEQPTQTTIVTHRGELLPTTIETSTKEAL